MLFDAAKIGCFYFYYLNVNKISAHSWREEINTKNSATQKTASNVIIQNNEVLLILEGDRATNSGLYSVPGGRCGPGELPVFCAIREAFEEARVVVEINEEIGNFFTKVRGNCFHGHVYASRIVSGVPSPGSGIKAVCWAHLAVIEELEKRGLMIEGKLIEAVKGHLARVA